MLPSTTIATLASEGGSFILDASQILSTSAINIVRNARHDATITFKNVTYLSTTIHSILRNAMCKVVFDLT